MEMAERDSLFEEAVGKDALEDSSPIGRVSAFVAILISENAITCYQTREVIPIVLLS
jgi:hypothetical protein